MFRCRAANLGVQGYQLFDASLYRSLKGTYLGVENFLRYDFENCELVLETFLELWLCIPVGFSYELFV